ncbi:MAG: divergent polysaccharide deacetylase family protein [Rhodospirillales bacterium]
MDDPIDKLVPESKRKTRLAKPHRSGILIPPWWRQNRAFAVLALSVLSVIAALIVIGSAAERVANRPADAAAPAAETVARAEAPPPPVADIHDEEPLPADVYDAPPVNAPPDPAAGILHPIEDPGSVYEAEPMGRRVESLDLSDRPVPKPPTTMPPPREAMPEPAETLPETRPELPVETASVQPDVPVTPPTTEGPPPAWIRHAIPFEPVPGRAMIAIVIDDMGVSPHYTADAIELPAPMTMSFLTYARNINSQADAARARGHEIMLHVPMEPSSATVDPGPNVLLAGMPEAELRANLTWGMRQLNDYVGINNHMGSRFTQDREGMRTVLETIRVSGHLFLDSRTSGRSVAPDIADELGLPFASRNVFLDHEDDPVTIRHQLQEVERLARKNGVVIAIGHPRPATVGALREWAPGLAAKGLQLAPVTAIVRQRWLADHTLASGGG